MAIAKVEALLHKYTVTCYEKGIELSTKSLHFTATSLPISLLFVSGGKCHRVQELWKSYTAGEWIKQFKMLSDKIYRK